jgi:hypothetical protein
VPSDSLPESLEPLELESSVVCDDESDEELDDESDEESDDEPDEVSTASGNGIGGRFSRSSGMSGGGTGG